MIITSELYEEILLFAIESHKGQVRKGDKRPYILHPISVMNRIFTVKSHSKNLLLLGAVSLLHDVVEDCGVTIEEIGRRFGWQIASIVDELTTNEEEKERLGKKEYLRRKMSRMSTYALSIKLCDRLDNVIDMKKMGKEFKEKYIEETEYILNGLTRDLTGTHKKLIKLIQIEIKKYSK